MIRALVSADIAMIFDQVISERPDMIEVNGNDVRIWKKSKRKVEDRIQYQVKLDHNAEAYRDYQDAMRYWHESMRDAREDYDRLYHDTLWCFNIIREVRLRKELDDVKSRIVRLEQSEPTIDEYRRRHPEEIQDRVKYVERDELYYHSTIVWHTSKDSETVIEQTEEIECPFNLEMISVNWSIIIALQDKRLKQRVEDVNRVVEDCQKNHHEKGKVKMFLDTAREGKQFSYVSGTLEDVLSI